LADVAATLEITEEDLRAYYEAERDALATTEERHVRHILITPEGDDYAEAEAEANAALARIEAGEDFATVAAEVSDDAGTRNAGGDLGWMTRGVLVGPFEDTLFEMEVGDVAGPVETEFGFHVLMLEDVRRGDVQSFEMVRDDLLAQLSTEEASGVFFDRANQLADAAFDAFDELASAAEAVGLPLETVQGFTRSNEQGLFENSPAAIAAAFDDDAIVSGENSALLELTDDDVAVLRVVAHHDPEPRPLDEVSDEIRETLALQGGSELARTQALEFVAAIEQGVDDIGALAAEQGATWTEATWFQRTAPETPQAILAAAFAVPAVAGAEPVVQQVPLGNGDEAVILVSAVERGDPERLPVAERDQRLSQLADQAAQQEMIGYAAGVRERASVRVPDEVLEPQF
jgi:peptidyl-prolyl cis-trans isomerase D